MCKKQKEKIKGNSNGTSGSVDDTHRNVPFSVIWRLYAVLLLSAYVGKHDIHRGKLRLIDKAAGGIDGTV